MNPSRRPGIAVFSLRLAAALAVAWAVGPSILCAADDWTVKSPDETVVIAIHSGERLTYDVAFRGHIVVEPSQLGIVVDGHDLGQNVAADGEPSTEKVDDRYATRGVHALAINRYNGAVIPLKGRDANTPWQLEVRAFDDGVAYRYRVPGDGVRRIAGESSEWTIPVGTTIWQQNADNRSYEGRYEPAIVGQLPRRMRLMAPAALVFPDGAGYGLMTEANLVDYSDMALAVAEGNCFRAIFQDDPGGWEHAGEIVSPWRVTLLAADLNTLVNSDLVKNLCPPPAAELANAAWIRPGRSTWHWLTGGAPKLDEQKAWIDGAKGLGYEYHLVDDGWRKWNGGGDSAWTALAELVEYAKGQGVEIWAWVDAKYVFTPEDRAAYFRRAKEIGIVGLKIDFPKPASYQWVRWYDDTLRDAAAAQLMVDFHGPVKPTGRERTWPHEMTREAICGREQGKLPATHDTALPFLRYVQGHADYTPTLLIRDRLNGSSFAHELAMAIVFTSPYLCMGDNPERYLASDAADVLKALPPVWDETLVLPGSEIGGCAAFARRRGQEWFIGIINGSMPRRATISLPFLNDGKYSLVELADDADRNNAFVRTERSVGRDEILIAPLRRDGGYVARLVPSP
jgi:alpha-glucosidase